MSRLQCAASWATQLVCQPSPFCVEPGKPFGNPLLLLWISSNVAIFRFPSGLPSWPKVVTAILLNCDTFDGESTCRAAMLAAPGDAQKEAGTKIGRKLFQLNRRALCARYGLGNHLRLAEFVFAQWADATPVEQFKAMCCLLYQCNEGAIPNSQVYGKLNRAAGELAQRIVQDLPEYDKASLGD